MINHAFDEEDSLCVRSINEQEEKSETTNNLNSDDEFHDYDDGCDVFEMLEYLNNLTHELKQEINDLKNENQKLKDELCSKVKRLSKFTNLK